MDVAVAPVEGRTGSRRRWMSRIELLSYSRRTPVMLDAPEQTVLREKACAEARLADKGELSTR